MSSRGYRKAAGHLDSGSVLATAGHVDHGKSTLIRALTGIDPDRLAEEKARGLTIDLGFAWTRLPSGRRISFVDVPGHVRFIRNMLAGAGAVGAAAFVVAATEGWKAQSEEHLRILDLLGVGRGVIVLSMADRVDAALLEARRVEVRGQVAETFLAAAPLLVVDSLSGRGMDQLVDALEAMEGTAPPAADRGRPRLWIDRSFALAGAGAVVTGTLTGGPLTVGQVLTAVPGAHRARVRALQSHRSEFDSVGPGNRVAVNLAGISHHLLGRGQALVIDDQWWPTRRVDASVSVLSGLGHPVGRRGAYQLHVGTAETPVRLRILQRAQLEPGAVGCVRLHLATPLPLSPGDRFVLRESGRSETVGGGAVLDADPVLPAARARPDGTVERAVTERGWVDSGELFRLTGFRRPPDVGRWVVSREALRTARSRLDQLVEEAGPYGLDLAGLDERHRALAEVTGELEIVSGRLRPAGRAPEPTAESDPWLDLLKVRLFDPPPPVGIDRARLRGWLSEGLVVECDGIYFSALAVQTAATTVAALLAEGGEGVTASAVRSALGTSRKFALPLLVHLDRTGVTRRRGDLRVGGPRLPQPSAQGPTRPEPL